MAKATLKNKNKTNKIQNLREHRSFQTTRIMSRVDINGQFNPQKPFSSCGRVEAKVDRQTTNLTKVPRNFGAFCDSVDTELKAYDATRSQFKIWGNVSGTMCFIMIILFAVSNILGEDGFVFKNLSFIFILTALPYAFVFIYIGAKVKAIWKKIEGICNEKGGNGVRYEIHNEHFGGMNKGSVRRYFFLVHVDEEGQGQVTPVVTAMPAVATDSKPEAFNVNPSKEWNVSDPPPANTWAPAGTATGGTTSIFDQLKV